MNVSLLATKQEPLQLSREHLRSGGSVVLRRLACGGRVQPREPGVRKPAYLSLHFGRSSVGHCKAVGLFCSFCEAKRPVPSLRGRPKTDAKWVSQGGTFQDILTRINDLNVAVFIRTEAGSVRPMIGIYNELEGGIVAQS